MRPMSHRESVLDYQIYVNKRKSQIAQLKKEEFETSLRESTNRTTHSNSALFGASRNIFDQALTKDIKKDLSLMDRKRKMNISMSRMINDLSEPDFDRFEGTMIEFELTK